MLSSIGLQKRGQHASIHFDNRALALMDERRDAKELPP